MGGGGIGKGREFDGLMPCLGDEEMSADREGRAKVTLTVGEHRGLAAEPPAKGSDLRHRGSCVGNKWLN